MNISKPEILCLHQAADLYGSDRSFLSAVQALADYGSDLDVVLPSNGKLVEEIQLTGRAKVTFYGKGILRKSELKKPVTFLAHLIQGVFFYLRLFSRYRIIYINTIVMLSALVAACFFRFSKRRIICHVREIPGKYQLLVFRLIFSLSGVELIFNSQATKDAFKLPGEVIYNGVAPTDNNKETSLTAADGSKLKFLLIGRINHWKGQDFFIDTLALLTEEQRESIKVRIVGSPFEGNEHLSAELADRIHSLGLERVVELIPFCDDPSLHYLWSDFVVVPSTLPEPFGRVAIEAFSFSKPVIAASHGGLMEIVESNVSGLLFEPASKAQCYEAIVQSLEMTKQDYMKMSLNALHRYENYFSLEQYMENIRNFFFAAKRNI